MMKRHPPAQGEGPGAVIPGRLPKLRHAGQGLELGVELDQAVEDLADEGTLIDIGQRGGVERGGVVTQHPAVHPPELPPGRCRAGGPTRPAKLEWLCVSRE
jgi:hypothetical protein